MALKRKVAEIATCRICFDYYKSPRTLRCLHSFCLKCLQSHWKHKSPGAIVECPVCRAKFPIPEKRLDSLKVNFDLESLVEAISVSDTVSGSGPCEVCRLEAATVYCVDCFQQLCEVCSLSHEDMRTGAHDVRPLKAKLSAESYCDKHPDKRYELYCFDCEGDICRTCFAISHRQHRCKDITGGNLSTDLVTTATLMLILRWFVVFGLFSLFLSNLNYLCYHGSPTHHNEAIVVILPVLELIGLWLCSGYPAISSNTRTICIICIGCCWNYLVRENNTPMINLDMLFKALCIYLLFGSINYLVISNH